MAWAGLIGALGLLTVAEVDWLHRLPAEASARAAVVFFPAAGGQASDLGETLQGLALAPEVLAAIAASSGLKPTWLADHLRVSEACIQTANPAAPARKGLLVAISARGDDVAALERATSAWSRGFLGHAAAVLPGLVGYPRDAFLEPIRTCD
ncbi:MAG: hypothetical protein FJZ01_21730 [Candidatus Sericytochromatia bacterium]|nr:hypothetical protein [Candidatus Tanganyikabacteria bacterium]